MKKFGNSQAKEISAFIYQGNLSKSVASQEEKQKPKIQKKLVTDKIALAHNEKKISVKQNDVINTKPKTPLQSSVSQGESTATLIAMLHDAIQRKQQYPASAMEMQREGRATVVFQLHENGEVSHLRILTSSGTTSLDQAAIRAVNDAAPFKDLLKYIQGTKEYQIDIVFELT